MHNKLPNYHQKTAQKAVLVDLASLLVDWIDNLAYKISKTTKFVNRQIKRAWTRRELNSVDLGYQSNLANLPSPRRTKYNIAFVDTHPIGQIFKLGKKKAVWKKVNQLKTGMKIAIEKNGQLDWDEIVAIKPVGREQVWDIEVANTHNFVGNGVLAHNTYISGNVGIGTTTPSTLVYGDYSVDGAGVSNLFSLERTDPNTPLNNFGVGLSFLLDRDDTAATATESGRIETIMTDVPTAATAMTFLTKTASSTLSEKMRILADGNVGIGTTTPTALLHLKAGTTTLAPLKLTSGTNLTTAQAGGFEYDGAELYFTPVGTTRETVAYVSDITAAAHNPVTLAAIGAAPNANGMTISVTQVLNLEPASASFGGVVTTGTQTLAGAKTLSGATTVSNTFTVSGSNLTSLGGNLTVTGTAWTATPTISGAVTMTSGFDSNAASTVAGLTVDTNGNLTVSNGTLSVTAPTTTGAAGTLAANSLTTGDGLNISSTSNAITTANLIYSSLTQAAATGTAVSGDINAMLFNPTYSTAITTPAISGNVLDVSRTSTTNGTFVSTLTVSGALATLSDSATQTTGTLTHTASVLDVTQNYTSSTGTLAYFKNYGAGVSFRVDDVSGDATPFVIAADGNVGVGTTSPTSGMKLDIQDTQAQVQIKSTTTTNRAYLGVTGGQTGIFGVEGSAGGTLLNGSSAYASVLGSIGAYPLQLGTNNTINMTILSGGNVGIGTTAPGAYKLNVQGKIYALTQGTATGEVLTAGRAVNTSAPLSGGGALTGDLTLSCPTCVTTATVGWTLAGTSGTPQSIGIGDTATIAAGTGITTTAGATDTVTIAATLGTSIAAAEVDIDSLDFTEFQDTLDLDAALILNQTTNTWTQTFTGTTATGLTYTANSLTTGDAIAINGGDATTTGAGLSISGVTYTHGAAETGSLIDLAFSDTTSAAFTTITNGLLITPTINTTAANTRTFNGISIAPVLTACGTTAGNCTLNDYLLTTPALTQTTTNIFNINGVNLSTAGALVQNTAAGTINWTGATIQMPNITQTTGTVTSTGLKITGGTVTSGTAYALTTSSTAGNVGIGTTGPLDKLHITGATAGAGDANTAIYLEQPANTVSSRVRLVSGVTGGTNPYFAIEARHGTSPWDIRERLRIDNQGNVGIGTTGPGAKLEVVGNVKAQSYESDATNVETVAGTYTATKMVYKFNEGRGIGYNSADDRIYFAMNEGVPMVIDNSGNVGIGTTSPGARLDVVGGVVRVANNDPTNFRGFQAGSSYGLTIEGYADCNAAASILQNAYLLGDPACVGSTAFKWLDTHGSMGSRGIEFSGATGIQFFADAVATTANTTFTPTERMRITNAGNVGIGTTAPGAKLEVGGQVKITGGTPGTNKVLTSDSVGLASWTDLSGIGVTSVTGTTNQITASPTTGAVVLSIPADFRAPGTVNAVSGIYTGATAGTLRLDAAGALSNITSLSLSGAISGGTTYSGSGNITSTAGVLTISGTGNSSIAGNVGIGTTGPDSKLEISGAGSTQLKVTDTTGTSETVVLSESGYGWIGTQTIHPLYLGTGYAAKVSILTNGNVGIGTTGPGAKLEVAGQVKITGGTPGTNKVLTSDSVGLASWTDLSGIGVTSVTGTGNQITSSPTTGAVVLSIPSDFRAPGTVNAVSGIYTGAGAGTIRLSSAGALSNITTLTLSGAISGGTTYSGSGNITSTAGVLTISGTGNSSIAGNVGIGTTGPGAKLEVAGQVKITGGTPGTNKVLTSDSVGLASWTDLSGIGVTSVTGTGNQITSSPTTGAVVLSIPSDFRAPGTVNAVSGIYTGAGAGTIRLSSAGALSNITTLTLSGAISGGTTYSGSGNITSTAGVLTISGTGNSSIAGNVGIGTTGPDSKLEISGAGSTQLKVTDTTGTSETVVLSESGYGWIGTQTIHPLYLGTGYAAKVSILTNGNVGIGTTAPGSELEIGTTTKASNTIARVLAGDSYNAGFEAYGSSQGTGYLYVGQASAYGGGVFYNGDGTPAFATGEAADRISFYRKNAGTNEVAFSYAYNSNDVNFRGNIDVGGAVTGGTYNSQTISSAASFTGSLNAVSWADTVLVTNLNADLLDGLDSTAFIAVAGDTMTGTLTFSGVTTDITTAGNEHLALMPGGTGNVGIGTTAPTGKLEVAGTIRIPSTGYFVGNAAAGYRFNNAADTLNLAIISDSGAVDFYAGNASPKVSIQATSGNVGIGTTAPGNKLQVNNYAAGNQTLFMLSGGTGVNATAIGDAVTIGLDTYNSGAYPVKLTSIATQAAPSYPNNDFYISTNTSGTDNTRFYIKNSGNVGIGTTNPLTVLDVQRTTLTGAGITGTFSSTDTSVSDLLAVQASVLHSTAITGTTSKTIHGGSFSADRYLPTDTTTGTLTSIGVSGFATQATSGDFGTRITYGGRFFSTGGTTGTSTAYGVYTDSSGADKNYGIYAISADNYFSGNVGIGTTTATRKLQVETNASGWAQSILNDGNSTDRMGLRIQAGADTTTGTLISFYDGDGTSQGDITFNAGTVAYGTFTGNHNAQLPQDYATTGYPYGTIMCLDDTTTLAGSTQPDYLMQKCTTAYSNAIAGVYAFRFENKPNLHAIYAVGDGHALVTSENGSIKKGDSIVMSNYAGYGMKATRAGVIIGTATQDWTPSMGKETITLPNGQQAQAGLVSVYYYPGMMYPGSLSDSLITGAQAIIADIRAGLVTTQDLIVTRSATIADLSVTSLRVGGLSLQTYIEQVVQSALQNTTTPAQTLVSPVANIDSLTTQTASVSGSTTTQSLSVSGSTKLTALLADNATIAGTLTAEKIETPTLVVGQIEATSARVVALEAGVAQLQAVRAQTAEIVDATISGTLYANNIYGFEEKLATSLREPTLLETLIGQQTPTPGAAGVIAAAELAGYQATPSAALQATLADLQLSEGDVVLTSAALFVDQYFSVNGTGYIADTLGVGNKLFVGDGLEFSDGIIAYNPTGIAHPTLFIQPSGNGTLSLLAGLLILSDDGTVAINGNLNVAGTIKTDTLLSNLLQPADFGNPFQVQVAGISTESGEVKQSRFEIINELGTPVATISAQGKADFAGGIGVGSDTQTATSSSELTTDKTSGRAFVTAGSSEFTIHTTALSENSLVYVTPVGSTGNNVLYVKSQQLDDPLTPANEGQFVIGFDSITNIDVPFNWWVVN